MKKEIFQDNHKEKNLYNWWQSSHTQKYSLRKKTKGEKIYLKYFSAVNTKQLDHYVIPVLEDKRLWTVIHIGSNGFSKFSYHNVDLNDLANDWSLFQIYCYWNAKKFTILNRYK